MNIIVLVFVCVCQFVSMIMTWKDDIERSWCCILHFSSIYCQTGIFQILCLLFVYLEFVNYVVSKPAEKKKQRQEEDEEKVEEADISYDDLMARIRHHVLTNRLRVSILY